MAGLFLETARYSYREGCFQYCSPFPRLSPKLRQMPEQIFGIIFFLELQFGGRNGAFGFGIAPPK